MGTQRGDHTVPEFYLREFRSDGTLANGATFFHQHDRDTGVFTREQPKKVLKRDRYYDLTFEDGDRTDAIDEFLTRVENDTAKLLQEGGFIFERRDPTEQERMALTFFIATMEIRAPELHDLFAESLTEMVRMMLDARRHHLASNPELFRQEIDTLERRTGQSFDGITPDHLDPSRYEIEANRDFVLGTSLVHGMEPMLRIIDGQGWTFLVAQEGDVFITSDRPLLRASLGHPAEGPPGFSITALNQDNEHFIMPLTRKVALVTHLEPARRDRGFVPAPPHKVAAINTEVWHRAPRFRFLPRLDFPGLDAVQEHNKLKALVDREVATMAPRAASVSRRLLSALGRTWSDDELADEFQGCTSDGVRTVEVFLDRMAKRSDVFAPGIRDMLRSLRIRVAKLGGSESA